MSESVAITGESIKLGQFIKLANLVESGGHAKELIAEGAVSVNGEVDTRRGRTLVDGDEVTVDGRTVVVSGGVDGDSGDYFDEATADDDFDPEKWRNM
ncbi:RNA-binding S4 domain-containing protein [Corynebacterium guangdongense]|uniref:Ribosome-associated protein YbcJ (S4-like RNA binding protein) n=1 Tax=Corynebacterium guangdongense TaxID=1783348 RepID=A0ABU2A0L3_9CORY|nr:RNA-binding S4 domain-containing protein [Corynebacterium guangdongense]MDR7330722.1 ribosome-associated protein YbcJ (S4-like RNA binding protein) [Corynebacterium guangdongense]WJZ16737.1 ribosome-associated protein [Corynebacterium guangdongense]